MHYSALINSHSLYVLLCFSFGFYMHPFCAIIFNSFFHIWIHVLLFHLILFLFFFISLRVHVHVKWFFFVWIFVFFCIAYQYVKLCCEIADMRFLHSEMHSSPFRKRCLKHTHAQKDDPNYNVVRCIQPIHISKQPAPRSALKCVDVVTSYYAMYIKRYCWMFYSPILRIKASTNGCCCCLRIFWKIHVNSL